MDETETLLLIPGKTSNGCKSYCRLCIVSIGVSKELLNFNLSWEFDLLALAMERKKPLLDSV